MSEQVATVAVVISGCAAISAGVYAFTRLDSPKMHAKAHVSQSVSSHERPASAPESEHGNLHSEKADEPKTANKHAPEVSSHGEKNNAKPDAKPDAKSAHGATHWEYAGELGPDNWHTLSPDFSACQAGQEQSPINLSERISKKKKRPQLSLSYSPSSGGVLDNGHTIQINVKGENVLKLGENLYNLAQFHFHSPSEHQLNKISYPLEFHFVHKSEAGKLAVLGVLVQEGEANSEIETILANLPAEQNKENPIVKSLFNPMKFFPEPQNYFSYPGSLTTPPCGEKVAWQVMRKPITMSAKQIESFTEIYAQNARPTQDLKQRELLR